MKKIWVNGTFDVLHIGHIKLLEYASSLGVVRVGLDTDERVKLKKDIIFYTLNAVFFWSVSFKTLVKEHNSDLIKLLKNHI